MKSATSPCSAEREWGSIGSPMRQSAFPEGSAMNAFDFESSSEPTRLSVSIPMSSELQIGVVLDDRFKIVDVINRGGMAWIYEALDAETGGTVAIKIPFMQFESDPGFF